MSLLLTKNKLTEISVLLFACAFSLGASEKACALDVKNQAVCGVLERFDGEIELLTPNREISLPIGPKAAIPCGGWVSVGPSKSPTERSWAVVRHRDGLSLMASAGTFIQLNTDLEKLTLYKGELVATVLDPSTDLHLITPNGRVRMRRGSIILIYSQTEEETQLVALENSAILENRFDSKARISVRPGEATSLNFKVLRVVPSAPKVVAVASLKEKLSGFPVDEQEENQAIQLALKREKHRMVHLSADEEDQVPPTEMGSYERFQAGKDDGLLQKKFVDHATSGATASPDEAQALLHPGSPAISRAPASDNGKAQKGAIQIEDHAQATDDAEKRHLIEELSKIRDE